MHHIAAILNLLVAQKAHLYLSKGCSNFLLAVLEKKCAIYYNYLTICFIKKNHHQSDSQCNIILLESCISVGNKWAELALANSMLASL